MRRALAVAAKAPEPGKVKTRLHSLLSPEDATRLYECFLRDTLTIMESVPDAEVVVSYTPAGAERYFFELPVNGHRLLLQRGDSFGDKLFNALEELLRDGFGCAVIMDADSPTLPPAYVQRAFEELEREGDRVVLGPAADGGYYLIGIKKPHRRIFEDIAWSTESVLGQTTDRAKEIGLEVALLPEWYDVDSPSELERLTREVLETDEGRDSRTAEHTRRFILSRRAAGVPSRQK